jgi:two-component system sensor histidine kinase KdpD
MMGRGRLRVYVGYAAGVGKTFAMLEDGRRRRARGTDVVIGFLETYGRPSTQAAAGDLEVLPRRVRGGSAGEADVAAILDRHPDVILVDELAHTNESGSANAKRWQDIEELLSAGIDVISTVNIQHLESLVDVVERITGAPQTQTVPDSILRAADQLELVDMTPQALRRRMAHGNVYPVEMVDAALSQAFREESLAALRELSLLWMADRVDEALWRQRREDISTERWETRERILVGIAGSPQDDVLIRRAARMAARRGGELLAVHVMSGVRSTAVPQLASRRELVEQVGGRYEEVLGDRVPDALLDVARAEHVTQIVLGASDRSWWEALVGRSVVQSVLRDSGPIDVHVISEEPGPRHHPLRSKRRGDLSPRRRVVAALVGALALGLLTLLIDTFDRELALASVVLLYVTAVVVIAAAGGLWPAIAAAVASSLLINWFFTPPVHTWTIAESEDVVGLVVFLIVAAVVSLLVGREARQRAAAQRGRAEAEALARLAARLAAEDDPLPGLVENLRATFGLDSVAVLRRTDGDEGWSREAAAGADPPSDPEQGTDLVELGRETVLVLRGSPMPAESVRVLQAFGAQLTVAIRGRALAREAAEAASLAEVDALRTAILAAVSHDLRTPLASIKASVSSLRDPEVAWTQRDTAEFLETIESETDRLTNLVENLLDMSRLQTGALHLVLRTVGLDEVVPRALSSLGDSGRDVVVDVPEELARVEVDPGLLERAVANIAANARTWSADRPVRIQGSQSGGRVELRIVDRGPGVPREERARIFQPFQRLGDRTGTDGVGLGLAVARGFVEAMGGELRVEDTPGGGLTMVIGLQAVAP